MTWTPPLQQAQFQQVVQLAPLGAGGFYIHNDIFRVTAERPINAPAEWDGAGMQEFVTQFYRTFDGPRAEIAPLYVRARACRHGGARARVCVCVCVCVCAA
jgi:hypothetical protein